MENLLTMYSKPIAGIFLITPTSNLLPTSKTAFGAEVRLLPPDQNKVGADLREKYSCGW